MEYFGGTYDFACEKPIREIQAAWNAAGPYRWNAFDNEQYGIYIVARVPEENLKIRLLGDAPHYSLELDCHVVANRLERMKSRVVSTMFERLLPVVGATAIRDTSDETRRAD